MFELNLQLADHIRRYSISAVAPSGWEVRLEEDETVRRRDRYDDWHRVERQLSVFAMRVETLKNEGWVPVRGDATAAPLVRHAGSAR